MLVENDCESFPTDLMGRMPFIYTDRADIGENESKEVKAAFESYKSKTYALTVPLRVVALRNSVPPLWIKV